MTARTRAVMMSQAGQQRAKIGALDQQIAQKQAEAESLAATIEKLEAGLPLIAETAEVRRKALKMEYGNRIAHLEAQLKLTEQRAELNVQRRRTVEITAARTALERQREQTQAEYAQSIVKDLAEAEQKAAGLTEDLVKAEKKMADQVLRAPVDGTVQQLAIAHRRRSGDPGAAADGDRAGRQPRRGRGDDPEQGHRLRRVGPEGRGEARDL